MLEHTDGGNLSCVGVYINNFLLSPAWAKMLSEDAGVKNGLPE